MITLPLIGGVLIGVSSSIMLGTLGRITGISGILGTTITSPISTQRWRWTFILGLVLGAYIMKVFYPEFFSYQLPTNKAMIILAGILVGFGTRLGAGCTSGHGVCGIPRMSKRSILATLTFMLSGILTILLMRYFT